MWDINFFYFQTFSQDEFRGALVDWIVLTNQPSTACSEGSFLNMLDKLNPAAKSISKETVKRDIALKFEQQAENIKSELKAVDAKFSFSIDAWTSRNQLAFTAIRIHFIDNNWSNQSTLLDFCTIEGNHSGENFKNIFVNCLERYVLI